MAVVLIVDAAYLLKASKRYGLFDYIKLKTLLSTIVDAPFVQSHYLNSVPDVAATGQDRFHAFMRAPPPRGPGFSVHLYEIKRMDCTCPACGHDFGREVQKGVDVGIATLILKAAMDKEIEAVVLCAGDGDFEDAVAHAVEECGTRLLLAGFSHSLSATLCAHAASTIRLESHWAAIQKTF